MEMSQNPSALLNIQKNIEKIANSYPKEATDP